MFRFLIRNWLVVARKSSPMSPLENLDIDMAQKDLEDITKNTPTINFRGNVSQASDGIFSDRGVDSSERKKPECEVDDKQNKAKEHK